MSYKVLEQNGVLNENIDGAAFNNFCAKNMDGIIGGILEECPMYLSSSNVISIGSGLLIIKGFRVKILEDGLHFSIPSGITPGVIQIICSLTLNKDRSVLTEIYLSEETVLKQDNILIEEEGKYEVELGRFYWDGSSAKNLTRSISVIPVDQQAGESIELAPTLDGNEADKAPSVKAVNEGLNLKAEKTDVEALEKDVAELNFILGTQYEIRKLENGKPVKIVPSEAIGTQIFFNRIEPTYYFDFASGNSIIMGNKIANAYSVGDYEDYNSDAFSVSVSPNGSSLTINTLDADSTYNEMIDVHFDSVKVKAGEPIFLSYRVVSGSYTPTGDEPKLHLRVGKESLRLPISSTRTPDDGFKYYTISSPSNTTISSFSVDLTDEVAFNNFVIDVSIGCYIGDAWIYPKFPYYLGGKYLGEIEKFARHENARLDRGYFNRETFEIAYNYVDMDTRELVIKCEQTVDGATEPCEERRVSIDEILTNMDFDGFIEASARDKITFEASDYNIYYNHSVFSYVVSTLGG